MEQPFSQELHRRKSATLDEWSDQVLSRTAGAPIVGGNRVRLLRDAIENYPAWLDAIETATKWIHFESYIIHEDDAGRAFADILAAKALQGVKVRVVYDWLGGLGKTSRRFWQRLRKAGIEVRCFNPPRLDSPLGWIPRDHRKMIGIDGEVAFVTGLCVGRRWIGETGNAVDPWRDTGIEVRGPAVAHIEAAFAQVWASLGTGLKTGEIPQEDTIPQAGEVTLRVVASVPNAAGLYRLDQQIAALAKRYLWLTDAYYVGITPYVQALRAAARDGVEVRLLVPGASDIPLLRVVSRAGYKPLLDAGVRVFEWNGSMIHAKTAVADGRWARVGSTNLNLASWVGNYELDVVVEDEAFAAEMEEMYLDDLENATEIVLVAGRRARPLEKRRRKILRPVGPGTGSVGRVGVGAIRIGNAVGAAITNHRVLGPAEARVTSLGGTALLVFAIIAVLLPRWVTIPIAIITGWIGVALLVKSWRLRRIRCGEMENQQPEGSRENGT
jgi:cardiolipin synthase